jgi:hypothetical protein
MSSTLDDNNTCETPEQNRGSAVTDAIRAFTDSFGVSNDDEKPNAKRPRYLKFTPDQLSQLIIACSTPGGITSTLHQASPSTTALSLQSAPAYVTSAKYEEISCKPIKPTYEGNEADLMPFLLRVDIRHQDEGWASATFITNQDTTYDLMIEFVDVTEEHVTELASRRWTSHSVSTDKHNIGHDTCHSRLLAKCLLASISHDLSLTLLNRIPTLYRNDGTYLLWTLTSNIYRNNIAFVESTREKIVTATKLQHDNDIEKYLIFIKNHLRMITTKHSSDQQHCGLITYILQQLKTTPNQIFLRYVQDLHVSYQEGKLPKYTPSTLITDVEDKIRVLKHAEVWDTVICNESPAMALTVTPTLTDQLKEYLANQITTEFNKLSGITKSINKDGTFRGKARNQDWLYVPPTNTSETKTVQNRTYHWCTKRNHGNGQWVITHNDSTHRAGYQHRTSAKVVHPNQAS